MLPALFLDRDGVIIENRDGYVRTWEDVELLPGAADALAFAQAQGWRLIIVTNQSGVARGLIPLEIARGINDRLVLTLENLGVRIDGVYLCPHAPEENCNCRKPKPGLLLQAAAEHNLDLTRSVMIGDAVTDVQAGQAAGVPRQVMVLTGRGQVQAVLPEAGLLPPFILAADLAKAVSLLGAPG